MKKLLLTILFTALIPFTLSACGDHGEHIDIYASIYPVEFLVKEIVRDKYKVKAIYPRGKNVHDYTVSPAELISLAKCKIIFYIGLGLEPVIEHSKDTVLSDITMIPLTDELQLLESNAEDSHHIHHEVGDDTVFYDPHVWLDPLNMQIMAEVVLDGIIENMEPTPEEIAAFTENYTELKNRLDELHLAYLTALSNEDIANLTIMVDHDAYAYWQPRYNIKRIKLRSDNDIDDMPPKDMANKISEAKSLGIRFICTTKNEMESRTVNAYLSELGLDKSAKKELHHLGTITAKEEKDGKDYFIIMYENLEILKEILPKKTQG